MKEQAKVIGRSFLQGLGLGLPLLGYALIYMVFSLHSGEDLVRDFFDGFGSDPPHEAEVAVIDVTMRRPDGREYVFVLGSVTNRTEKQWDNLWIEADLFDENGKFLDKDDDSVRGVLPPRGCLHFKMTVHIEDEEIARRVKTCRVVLAQADEK